MNKSNAGYFEHTQKFFGKSLQGFAATEQPNIFSVSEGAANRSKRQEISCEK